MSIDKINNVIKRLATKMTLSQTPVPGFIIGVSGTDSIMAAYIAYAALAQHQMCHRLQLIHYVNAKRRKPTWFEANITGWLTEKFPEAEVIVTEPLGGNHDQQRWADLHLRALNEVTFSNGGPTIMGREEGENYWTVGTINATEKTLGTYSMLARSTSVQVLHNIWKSEIIAGCSAIGVPDAAIENSRLPDCLCGRDEIAANNIEIIDDILRNRIDIAAHDPALLTQLYAYIHDTKAQNDFKTRTPFVP